jgi:hypothetical protein
MTSRLDEARAALKTTFGYDDFRPGQDEVIGAVLDGSDVQRHYADPRRRLFACVDASRVLPAHRGRQSPARSTFRPGCP